MPVSDVGLLSDCQSAALASRDGTIVWWPSPRFDSSWEGREGERHYTVSKLGCWIALERAVRLSDRLEDHADPEPWARERDAVRDTILREAWCEQRVAFAGARAPTTSTRAC